MQDARYRIQDAGFWMFEANCHSVPERDPMDKNLLAVGRVIYLKE